MNTYIIIAIAVILLIILFWYIGTINKFNRYKIKIDEASSGIDIALAKRYDVLTKMVDTVKGYTKHEKETLIEITKLRENMTMKEKSEVNSKMDEDYEKINLVVENYPDLKASENFKLLQKSILDVEEHLQASRRLYNANVSIYNQAILVFPALLIAKSKGFKKADFFEAESIKKEDVKIEL